MSGDLDETVLNYIEIFINENPEIYSSEKFINDFVSAWTKVMNLDRFDLN